MLHASPWNRKMQPENHRQPLRPSKSSARSRTTVKSQSQRQDATKDSQPNTLLFVDVSDPSESRREDRRKAVRSFVMKKYKQSQRSTEPLQTHKANLDDESGVDNTHNSLVIASPLFAENDTDSPHLLSQSPNHSSDVEDGAVASSQLYAASPDLVNAAPPNSPYNALGSGSIDPFDSYPAQIELRAHQLIDLCRLLSCMHCLSSCNQALQSRVSLLS